MMSIQRISLSLLLCLLTMALSAAAQEGKKEEKEEAKPEDQETKKEEGKPEEQEAKKEGTKVEEIVVTATKTEKDVSEAPASTSVVTKKDIEVRNIKTIDEALNTLPGVFSTRVRLSDISPAITMRGMPCSLGRTLVIMDGINLVDPMLGNLYGFAGLAPEAVERIEVVRGPFSSLYGGQAMGGVVNIMTKMPEKREFTMKSGYGSSWERGKAPDDLWRYYLSYGDRFEDKFSIFLSYGFKATNGFPTSYNVRAVQPPAGISGWSYTTDATGNTRFLIGDKGDTTWWDENTAFRAAYDFSETSKLSFSFYRSRFETHYDHPHTYLRDAAGNFIWSYAGVGASSFLNYDDMSREQYFSNLAYETVISTLKTKISFSYVDSTFQAGMPGAASTRFGGPGKGWENPFDLSYNLDLQFTLPLSEAHLLTFGGFFGHSRGQMDEYNRTDWKDEGSNTDLTYRSKGKDMTYALFAQDEITILDNLTAYVGFRQDWWETYDGSVKQPGTAGYPINYGSNSERAFSPKVALVYKPFDETTFRASAGMAFRSPTIVELYRTWTQPGGITYAGNSDLSPETTKSWDVGAEQGLWEGAKIKAAYFENQMKDFIYRTMNSPTLFENNNVGAAESNGVELEFEQGVGEWLRLFANSAWTDSRVVENSANPAIEGKMLTMLPKKTFNVGADITEGPFSAGLVGRYVSKVYKNDDNSDGTNHVYGSYDPYFVADAKFSYDVTEFAKLSFSVDNIFDEDYFYSDKAPGRSFFLELEVELR